MKPSTEGPFPESSDIEDQLHVARRIRCQIRIKDAVGQPKKKKNYQYFTGTYRVWDNAAVLFSIIGKVAKKCLFVLPL